MRQDLLEYYGLCKQCLKFSCCVLDKFRNIFTILEMVVTDIGPETIFTLIHVKNRLDKENFTTNLHQRCI